MKKLAPALIVFAAIASVSAVALHSCSSEIYVPYETLPEKLAEKYHVHHGADDPSLRDNLFVSDYPLTVEQINRLRAGLWEEWQGVVRISPSVRDIESGFAASVTEPPSENVRYWGDLVAVGDANLLDEIEMFLQN